MKHDISRCLTFGTKITRERRSCISSVVDDFRELSPLVLVGAEDTNDPKERSTQIFSDARFLRSRSTAKVGGKDEEEWWSVVSVRSCSWRRLGRVLNMGSGPLNDVILGSVFDGSTNVAGKVMLDAAWCK